MDKTSEDKAVSDDIAKVALPEQGRLLSPEQIRERTRETNETMRARLEAAERERWFDREIDAIKYGPHTMMFDGMISNEDGAPVAPESGHDGYGLHAFDLAGTPRSEAAGPAELDVNPAERPEGVAAEKAAPVAKKRKTAK